MSDLQEIRARAAAATPGPWGWFGNDDRVYLATRHSGRLYVAGPEIRRREYIFDHGACESYTIDRARERYIVDCALLATRPYSEMTRQQLHDLAKARGLTVLNAEDPTDAPIEDDFYDALVEWDDEHGLDSDSQPAMCERMPRLAEFIDTPLGDEEGARHFAGEDGYTLLSRGAQHLPDVRFAHWEGERGARNSGLLHSYVDSARYEVLDGRTIAEHEAAGGRIKGERRDLYRDDIVGIANPDADFIAHARADVDELLEQLDTIAVAAREYFDTLGEAGVDAAPLYEALLPLMGERIGTAAS